MSERRGKEGRAFVSWIDIFLGFGVVLLIGFMGWMDGLRLH